MTKLNQNRVVFFLLGTFLGSWVLGAVLGGISGVQK